MSGQNSVRTTVHGSAPLVLLAWDLFLEEVSEDGAAAINEGWIERA
jgi:hypothetical protein